MNIQEFRKQYPQYDKIDDIKLSESLHKKHYSHVPYTEFAARFLERPISTITAKPELTGGEKLKQTKSALRQIGPIAGDIAGTFLAPQLKGPKILIKLANLALRSGGAAAGAGTGELGSQLFFGEEVDPAKMGREALFGVAGEVVPSAGKKALKEVAKLATDFTILGKHFVQKIRDKLIKESTEKVQKFVYDIAPDPLRAKAINFDDMGSVLQQLELDKSMLYDVANKEMISVAEKHGGMFPLEQTKKHLRGLYEKAFREVPETSRNFQKVAESRVIQSLGFSPGGIKNTQHITLRRLMRGEDVGPEHVQYILATLFPGGTRAWGKLNPDIRSAKEAFKKSIIGDLESSGAHAAKIDADILHGEIKDFNQIKKIFDDAIYRDQMGNSQVNLLKLSEDITLNQKRIIEIGKRRGNPNLWPQMKSQAKEFKKLGEELRDKSLEAKSGAGGIFFRGVGGTVGTMLTGNPMTGFAVAEGFGTASSWALMSKVGQKTMKTVFDYIIKPGVKAGTHAVSPELMPMSTSGTREKKQIPQGPQISKDAQWPPTPLRF